MKRILFSFIVFLLVASCGYRPIYQEYRTYEPMHIIDSIATANNYSDADTLYWVPGFYLNEADTTLVRSWYQSWEYKERVSSMILIGYPDGEYLLKYKVE